MFLSAVANARREVESQLGTLDNALHQWVERHMREDRPDICNGAAGTDATSRDYYVSIVRSAKQRGLLAGPFPTHTEALGWVDKASRLARDLDPWADFDVFGTCSLPRAWGNPKGALNDRLFENSR